MCANAGCGLAGPCPRCRTYRVKRFFFNDEHAAETVLTGLTLESAQAYCKDPETSSRTATGAEAQAITDAKGPWFCGYEEET